MCNLLEIDMTSLIQYARKFFGKLTFLTFFRKILRMNRDESVWVHPFSAYTKFSEKLTFLTPTYVCVSGGKKYQFFGKFCVRTTWMIPNKMSYITYVYPLKLNNKDSRTTALCKKTPSQIFGRVLNLPLHFASFRNQYKKDYVLVSFVLIFTTQQMCTCSKSTIETLEKGVTYVQN